MVGRAHADHCFVRSPPAATIEVWTLAIEIEWLQWDRMAT